MITRDMYQKVNSVKKILVLEKSTLPLFLNIYEYLIIEKFINFYNIPKKS